MNVVNEYSGSRWLVLLKMYVWVLRKTIMSRIVVKLLDLKSMHVNWIHTGFNFGVGMSKMEREKSKIMRNFGN